LSRTAHLRFAELTLLGLTVAWGLSFVIVPWALEDAGYLTLTTLRMAVGLAFLLVLRPRCLAATALEWRTGLLGGALLAGGYVFQTAGLYEATPGKSGFLTAFYVALVPLIEVAVYRRAPPLRDVVVLLLATAGIAILVLRSDFTVGFGETLVALSAVFWAAQIVVVGRVADRVDPLRLAAVQLLVCGAVTALLWSGWVREREVRWTGALVVGILYLGIVTNAIGFLLQTWAQRRVPPTRVAILFSPEPVFAALFGMTLAHERFGLREIVGAALVMAAVAWTVWQPIPSATRAREA
jgi:drug/metabolite transporter (DMT)-like permease